MVADHKSPMGLVAAMSDIVFIIFSVAFLTGLVGIFLLALGDFMDAIRRWRNDRAIKKHNKNIQKIKREIEKL